MKKIAFSQNKKVIAYKLTDIPELKWKGVEVFDVDFPSFWDDDREIEVGVVVRRNKAGEYKVVELEMPEDTPDEDFQEIALCYWYVFDKRRQKNKKCPPVIFLWEFDNPPVYVVACQRPGSEKWIPLSKQLKEMEQNECTCPEDVHPRDWPGCEKCKIATCGYSRCFEYNEHWAAQGGICGYEHCIENMPFTNEELSCPIFGHDCPGGKEVAGRCKGSPQSQILH